MKILLVLTVLFLAGCYNGKTRCEEKGGIYVSNESGPSVCLKRSSVIELE